MSGKCTWVGCDSDGIHELGDRNGQKWAILCESHNDEMDRAVNSPQVGDIVRAWVRAQGGAKAAAARTGEAFRAEWAREFPRLFGSFDKGHRRD